MNHALDILIAAANPGAELARTAASLAAQTERGFSVVLGEGFQAAGNDYLNAAQRELEAAGIEVRRLQAPFELKRLEFWNWVHAQSRADWLKPLLPGEELKPAYVARLKQRISERAASPFIRCDVELQTDWGPEIVAAPFAGRFIPAAEFPSYFPARVNWISRSINVAYRRTAWLALGGYATQFHAGAALNANVILALHHGVENIDEALVTTDLAESRRLNEGRGGRVNLPLELWLVLRQARNYCRAAKIPWPGGGLFVRGVAAVLGRGF